MWKLFIFDCNEMDHLFSAGVGEEVRQLVLCDYNADLMHRLRSKQEA